MGLVAGVDEAGRGCAIGPLVVVGALFEEEALGDLLALGVRDSKRLTRKRREALEPEIMGLARAWAHFDLQPSTIDKVVSRGVRLRRLNYLEAMAMARVIRELRPDKVFMDPADVLPQRYAEQVVRVLPFEPEVVCESRADAKYPAVMAASILAKVRRDRILEGIRERHGDVGSGYPSDSRTISFLESWFSENDDCPPFIRGSWAPVRRIRGTGA